MRAIPRCWALATRLAALVFVAAACSSTSTPPTASPTVPPDLSPLPSASLVPTATPPAPVAGHWEQEESLQLGRSSPHLVAMDGGRALVVGNDTGDCVLDNSVLTETFEPSENGHFWANFGDLAEPRADFVAVALADGRVLLTGGVDRGNTRSLFRVVATDENEPPGDAGHRSVASTYIYDPARGPEAGDQAWVRMASLGTPRTAPSAATLADGRVLVAGGYFLGPASTGADRDEAPAVPAVLAAWHAGHAPQGVPRHPVLDNDGPPPTLVPGIATAELYDPASDTWTPTGSMRFARFDAPTATLADGRVLVVGSGGDTGRFGRWNYTEIEVADEAAASAELYDPATGRFSLVDGLPPVDWSSLGAPSGATFYLYDTATNGRLVALADGGALLVGRADQWEGGAVGGTVIRTFRFDAGSGRWQLIDQTIEVQWSEDEVQGSAVRGHVAFRPLVARLGDGRVLVAGGQHLSGPDSATSLDTAEIYDPADGTWMALPPMPQHRAGGAAITLDDGTVLLVGGYYERSPSADCAEGPTGLASTLRFAPGP